MFRPTLQQPSPRFTVIDVSDGLSEVEKCWQNQQQQAAAAPVTMNWSCVQWTVKWIVGWVWLWITQIPVTAGSGGPGLFLVNGRDASPSHTHLYSHTRAFTDLYMFCHQAAGWIPQGSCSAPLWPCLYMSCRSHHCSRHRSLQMAAQRWKEKGEGGGVNG